MASARGTSEVRVRYVLTTDLDTGVLEAAAASLSAGERERQRRFLRPQDRRDFAVAHALLRQVLSSCAPVAPADWTFVAAPGGKPALTPDLAAATGLSFNLAHTEGLVACAVAHGVEVGIDVEGLDRATDALELAQRFFSAQEAGDLARVSGAERMSRFIEIWTLKEAFIKATGAGLAQPLGQFAFTVDAGHVTRFTAPPGADASAWQFALLTPSPRHRMAVAIAAAPGRHRLSVRQQDLLPPPVALAAGTRPLPSRLEIR